MVVACDTIFTSCTYITLSCEQCISAQPKELLAFSVFLHFGNDDHPFDNTLKSSAESLGESCDEALGLINAYILFLPQK